jgi:hypothetical protein
MKIGFLYDEHDDTSRTIRPSSLSNKAIEQLNIENQRWILQLKARIIFNQVFIFRFLSLS